MRYGADDPVSDDEAVALFGLLAREPVLVLAVSGGPDSTALLWLAARWRAQLTRPPKLIAVTVDHGLRKESAHEAAAVKKLARKLKVEHHTLRWTGRKPKTGIQEAAREARYRLLAQAAKHARAEYVLTAHTQDDQAETVLFRLMRGSGIAGLRGMGIGAPWQFALPGKQRCFVQRPLLSVSKSRLIATLTAAQVAFADDPSNRDPRFTRPRLRALMPGLAAEGLTAQRLALLAERVTRAEIVLHDALNEAEQRLAPGPWPESGPVSVDAEAFADLPQEIALRFLGRMIEWTGNEGPVELGKLESLHDSLDAALSEGAGIRRTLAGALVTLRNGKLTVERAPSRRSGAKPGTDNRKRAFTKPK